MISGASTNTVNAWRQTQLATCLHHHEAFSQGVGHLRLSIIPPQEHLYSGQVFSDDCQINSTPPVLTGERLFRCVSDRNCPSSP